MIPAPLLVVTDRHGAHRPLIETVRAALDGGARWIWFRDRDMERAARKALALDLLGLVRAAGGWLTIGGDAGLAAEIGADGAHLGAGHVLIPFLDDSLGRRCLSPPPCGEEVGGGGGAGDASAVPSARPPPRTPPHKGEGTRHGDVGPNRSAGYGLTPTTPPHPEVPASAGLEGGLQPAARSLEPSFEAAAQHLGMRARGGEPTLLGVSAHSLADVHRAAELSAGYATLSPIFATASKPGYGPALGLGALREASARGLPVLALGGITAVNAKTCREAGAAGVAVMGAIMRAADPAAATRRFLDALT